MTTHQGNAADEAALRALIESAAQGIRDRDTQRSTAYYAPDILLFDVITPLRSHGHDAARQRLDTWFATFDGPIGFTLRDLSIAVDSQVAFCHSLNQVSATLKNGERMEMWWRATLCLQKRDSHWQVTHAHSSVPMDVESGQAAIDLTP